MLRTSDHRGRSEADADRLGTGLIRYGSGHEAWSTWHATVTDLVSQPDVVRVCDAGGGAQPALSLDDIREHELEYVVADVCEQETSKASSGYVRRIVDVTSPEFSGEGGLYDLVITKHLAEHISDPVAFHTSVFRSLAPGGWAVHFFPTLFEPVFVANRLMPERAAYAILRRCQPERDLSGTAGKFPAYYRWCRGPTKRQLRLLRSTGFQIEQFWGFFGHGYFSRSPGLDQVEQAISRFLVRNPVPALTSFAVIVLRRPFAHP